jgi:hypothetical protein
VLTLSAVVFCVCASVAGEEPKWTLTSNLPDGRKWTIDFAHDVVVTRVTRVMIEEVEDDET